MKEILLKLLSSNNARLSADEIDVRVRAFVVIMVTLIFAFITFALLYSVTFVTQPIKQMAPIDQAYTKMLNDIVLLIVGGIGGVMSRKGVQAIADKLSAPAPTPPVVTSPSSTTTLVAPPSSTTGMPDFNFMGFKNPDLDENWRPPPPPTTPPDYIHPEREDIAQERAAARSEAV